MWQCCRAQVLLVDRDSARNKADSELRKDGGDRTFERLKIDIRHLNLRHAPLIVTSADTGPASAPIPLVGISKHLCGVATDLTLRCLLNSAAAPSANHSLLVPADGATAGATEAMVVNRGVAIALCCHHVPRYAPVLLCLYAPIVQGRQLIQSLSHRHAGMLVG